MKKLLAILLSLTVVLSFAACSKAANSDNTTSDTTSSTAPTAETTQVQTTAPATETTSETTTQTTAHTTTQVTTASTTKVTTTKAATTKKVTTTKKKTTTKKAQSGDVLALSYKGKTVKPNEKMKTVLKRIGKPSSEPEKSPSCMDTGYDLVYTYSGFVIETFCDEKGNETIVNIDITGKNVSTGNGIKVGAKTKDAVKASGLKFAQEDGTYTYKKGGCSITIYDNGNGKIEEIFLESTKF